MMRTYICKETFQVDRYDDDGFWEQEEMTVHGGSMFQLDETSFRCVGGNDTVRLIGITADEGTWLEITEEHLAEFFEEVKDGDTND